MAKLLKQVIQTVASKIHKLKSSSVSYITRHVERSKRKKIMKNNLDIANGFSPLIGKLCPSCEGEGYIEAFRCDKCHGTGRI